MSNLQVSRKPELGRTTAVANTSERFESGGLNLDIPKIW